MTEADDRWQQIAHGVVPTDRLPAEPAMPPILRKQSWSPQDLDRCEHGRHSIDNCFGCPGGMSTGNLYLVERHESRVPDGLPAGRLEVRIGTTYGGDPIWVLVHGGSR